MKHIFITFIIVASTFYCVAQNKYEAEGDIKYKNEDYAGAIIEYNKALNIASYYSGEDTVSVSKDYTYFLRGTCKLYTEDFTGAIIDLTKSLKNCPHNVNNFFIYGNRMIKFGEEYIVMKNSYSLQHSYSHIYYYRGCAKMNLKDFKGAIIDFNRTINDEDIKYKIFYYRGICRLYLGLNDIGCEDLRMAGELGNTDVYEIIKERCQ